MDRLSNIVQPEIKPGHDHCIDALRYSVGPLIRRSRLAIWDCAPNNFTYCGADAPGGLFSFDHLVGVELGNRAAAFLELFDVAGRLWVEREALLDEPRTELQLARDLIEFIKASRDPRRYPKILLRSGHPVVWAELLNQGYWVAKVEEDDESLMSSLRATGDSFAQGRLRIHERCTNLRREILNFRWDAEKDEPTKGCFPCCHALRRVAADVFQPWRLVS